MTTLTNLISQVRSQIDEVATTSTGLFFADSEITTWLNDGQRDMARRTEDLQSFHTTTTVTANVAKYSLPTDVIRVHRIEFAPTGQTNVYPLQASTYDEMDATWGANQTSPSAYPMFYVIWGTPGASGSTTLKVQLYPVPSTGGVLNIFYYRLPVAMSVGSDSADIVAGWDDTLVLYATYRAMMKDRNPMWQEFKTLYEQAIATLIDMSRQWHDQSRFVSTNAGFNVGAGNLWGWD